MAQDIKTVFFVSKKIISHDDATNFKREGFDLISQKCFDEVVADSRTRPPFAIIVDGALCGSQLCSPSGLLSKIQKNVPGAAVFLINATGVQRFELLKSDLAYAVFPNSTKISDLLVSISRYDRMLTTAGAKSKIRFGVSVPCLVKKLGASGLVQGEICDLSSNGMKVRVNSEELNWQTGDEIRFSFDQKTRQAGNLEGFGQLRWSVTNEIKPGVKETRMGFEFSRLPPPTLHAFLDLLNDARVQSN